MAIAARAVLDAAHLSIDDVRYIDLYSFFSAAVNFGCDALGITEPTGQRVTVTGGLPYAGGPASSYMLTSLAKMVRYLRSDPGTFGIVSGVGMMMTNHAYGLYSSVPPASCVEPIDNTVLQADADKVPQIPITDRYSGPVTATPPTAPQMSGPTATTRKEQP